MPAFCTVPPAVRHARNSAFVPPQNQKSYGYRSPAENTTLWVEGNTIHTKQRTAGLLSGETGDP